MPFRRFFPVFVFLLVVAVSDVAAQQLTVSRVIDGDTFELSDGRRVRLIGIDAPESRRSAKLNRDADRAEVDRDAVLALGIVATDYARMIAQDKAVELEIDQANAAREHVDRYGRTVAYVWVLDGSGDQDYMVNRQMVAEGYANTYTAYPFVYIDEFRELERQAREEGRGLWADDVLHALSPDAPQVFRAAPGSDALVASLTGRVFHRPSCSHASRIRQANRIYFVDRDDAEAHDYRACRTCHR